MALSHKEVWSILGVARTTDPVEIRRAYSRKLKVTNPEDDAEAFQLLRAAYEQALASAGQGGGRSRAAPPRASRAVEPEPTREAEPAPQPPPVPEPAAVELENWRRVEAERHQTLFRHLQQRVAAGAEDAELQAQLRAFLHSEAMDSIAAHEGAMHGLAALICNTAPKADALIEDVVQFFGWEVDNVGRPSPARDAVLARRKDAWQSREMRRPGSMQNAAFRALTTPPVGKRLWSNRFTPHLADEVRELLQKLSYNHPALFDELDPAAVTWWQAYLATPQMTPPHLAIAGALAILSGFAMTGLGWSAGAALGGGLAIATLAIPLWVYGVRRTQVKWRNDLRWEASPLLAHGWAPVLLLLLVAAVLLPPSLAATLGLGAAAGVALIWAIITGEPDRSRGHGDAFLQPGWGSVATLIFWGWLLVWRPRLSLPWRARALFAFLPLGLFWFAASVAMSDAAAAQITPVLILACTAFAVGTGSLAEFWLDGVSVMARRATLIALGTGAALAGLALWAASPGKEWVPAAAGLTSVLVLLHRVPTVVLGERAHELRDWAMRYGWLVWTLGFALAIDAANQGNSTMLAHGLWVLSGVVTTVIGGLASERPALWKQYQRA